ncbi:MAG: hypothetical protein QOD59_1524 [Mycobacterium sp.]|jgi:hypothetical protein|nr:hypothetical protein [Mycobacterium sp.]
MVPELAAGAAAELTELRDAVTEAAASLPQRWVAIGVGPADDVFGPQRVGTFAGYGVDVRIALSPDTTDAPAQLPLCVLIAGWLRGQANPEARAEVRVYAADHDVDAALGHGRRLRAEIDEADDPVGVLVIADGAHTLTAPAPGGYNPASVPVQHAVDDVLARGHIAALTALPTNIVGRVAFQVLAGLAEPEARSCTEFYRGAPYGVGYFVGVWQP